jgi:hypothetical protein
MAEYTPPEVVDYGSLAELTESCDFPGTGDKKFPDTHHTKLQIDSQNFCISN